MRAPSGRCARIFQRAQTTGNWEKPRRSDAHHVPAGTGGPLGEAISAVARRVGARRAEHGSELRVEARGTKDLHVRVGETVRGYAHHGVAREVADTGRRGAERIAEVLDPRPAARTAGHVATVLERVVAGSSAPHTVIARVVAL